METNNELQWENSKKRQRMQHLIDTQSGMLDMQYKQIALLQRDLALAELATQRVKEDLHLLRVSFGNYFTSVFKPTPDKGAA